MEGTSYDVFKPVMTDLITFMTMGSFSIYASKILKPFHRGFFCDDESIRLPHNESTVPAVILDVIGTAVPFILICFCEYREFRKNKKTSSSLRFGRYLINPYYWSVYEKVVCFASGALFTLLLTDIPKKVIGRLRPNFMSVCQPSNLANLCSTNTYEYITAYTCTGDPSDVEESRVSFPSGHSSFSFYVAIFLILYIQKRFRTRTQFLKPMIQFLILLLAWFVALSRVMDNKHHWSDVLTGIIIGTGVALVNTILVFKTFDDLTSHIISVKAANRTNGASHEAHDQL